MKSWSIGVFAGLIFTGLAASSSYAAISVSFNAASLSYVTDSSGPANYLNGDLVEVGTFAVAPTVGSPSLSGFSVFGTTLSENGAFSHQSTGSDVGFVGNQIYLVVFNAPTAGAATELAIAYVNNSSIHDPVDEWRFPGSLSVPNLAIIDVDGLFASPGTSASLAAGASIVYGAAGLDPAGYSLLETAPLPAVPLPEPSTYLLVGTSVLGLVALRRRK